ncbi:MAG: RNA-binding protein [Candidatus Dadabacteria bacterium]|nr:RNA-binding protein [Candidatus Dadabacteria bacterium]
MRLDKWLWCARFYKTRGLACHAIKSGKIIANNEKAKPAKLIHVGDKITIKRGPYQFDITILQLINARKSAKDAQLLYEESQESLLQREKIAQQLKAEATIFPRTKGRPSKRDRRELIKFKGTRNTY